MHKLGATVSRSGVTHVRRALCLLLLTMPVVPLFAQYGGPSILSRGGNSPGRRGSAPINFTFYGSARGLYETGLIQPTLDADGTLVTGQGFGHVLEFGAFGGHDWRRSSLGVDYRGDYRQQPALRQMNGLNQALSIEFSQRTSRRTQLALRQTGGTSNRAFGGFAAPAFADAGRLGVPINELFDVRTYYSQSGAYLTWQKSARLALVGGADAFFIKRQAVSLINAQGFRAIGSANYRLNARDMLGVNYQLLVFEFPKVFASTQGHTAALRWERRFTPSLSAVAQGGLFLLNTKGTESVTLSPEVAAILGRSTGVAFFRRTNTVPNLEFEISHTQARGRVYLGAQSGVGAGNGVFLTARRDTVNSGYSYTGLRRTSLGVSAGWSRQSSIALRDLSDITLWQAGSGVSYRLAERLNLTGQFDWREFKSRSLAGRSGYSASIGLSYSSSSLPLSIW